MIKTCGYRESEKALQLGRLFKPDEALKIKLIDELVEPSVLMDTAEDELLKWLKIPSKLPN
jgi:3,2-trans-enoyl-CoA isomerase